jgi:nucleotide-binding universal stress UspA family protein
MRLERILVPLDGSHVAELALPRATDLARPAGATVVLLRATAAHTIVGDPAEAQILAVREAEEYLERVAARLRAEGFERWKRRSGRGRRRRRSSRRRGCAAPI